VVLHRHTVSRKYFNYEADEVIWGSIDNQKVISRALENVEGIVHSAWFFSVPSTERPTINEWGTELLFKESLRAGLKFFAYISSVAVYGMKTVSNKMIDETAPLAIGEDLNFVYPSEKINVENILQSYDRKNLKLGIFRPGPIFDDDRGIIKKSIRIAGLSLGIGIGNGRNHMAYIHADDVANAVVMWLKKGKGDVIFNVTPTTCMRHKDWYRAWGIVHSQPIKPIFIRSSMIYLADFGVKMIKKILGKQSRGDVRYAIACATRNICYSNEVLKKTLGWSDKATTKYSRYKEKSKYEV
jgi:nucleoside-diphosphate-sugar epimerase